MTEPAQMRDVDEMFPPRDVDEMFPAEIERDIKRKQLGTTPVQDFLFSTDGPIGSRITRAKNILDAFGRGFSHAWGEESIGLSKKSSDKLRSAGVWNDYSNGERNFFKATNEAILGPSAIAMDGLLRTASGAFVGAQEAVTQYGVDLSKETGATGVAKLAKDVAAMPEAFQGSLHPMGVPKLKADIPLSAAERAMQSFDNAQAARATDALALANRARELGIIGDGTVAETPKVAPDPIAAKEAQSAVEKATIAETKAPAAEVVPPAKDVHAVAREIAPEIFTEYDDLANRKETFRRWIDELRSTREDAVKAEAPHSAEISYLQGKLADPEVTPRMRKKYEARLEPLIEERDAYIAEKTSGDSPDMAKVRERLMQTDYRMRDLSPQVSEAYREARTRLPEEAPQPVPEAAKASAPVPDQSVNRLPGESVEAPKVAEKPVEQPKRQRGEIEEYNINDPVWADTDGQSARVRILRDKDGNLEALDTERGIFKVAPAHRNLPAEQAIAATIGDHPQGGTPDPTKVSKIRAEALNPASPLATVDIAQDVAQKLVAAGRPVEEAQAAAQIVKAYWEARSARFKGAKGTAEEMYAREAPDVVKGRSKKSATQGAEAQEKELVQSQNGRIRLREEGRNTITLMERADASTFIHETGHDWLDRMMKDALDPAAPADLVADSKSVLKWLGVEKIEDIKTKQHEKFARGFETYMMEGRAPSQALATVFEQFKDWLTKIYQTVKQLKAPISEDIRDVFDRLLVNKPERREAVIAPERETKAFVDIHEADAATTPPERAHPVAETVQAERDSVATEKAPEFNDARLKDVANEARSDTAGSQKPDRADDAAGYSAGETGSPERPGTVSEGRSEAAEGGARTSTGAGEVPASPSEPFKGPASDKLDKAGNIRLDTLGTPEDVNVAIRDAAAHNDDFIEARRGVVSDGMVMDLADALGMDAEKLAQRKIGEAFNAEQVIAARKLLIESATKVRDAMVKAAVENAPDADVLAYAEVRARHQMIQEQVAGMTAEAGRALRAFRTLKGQQEAAAISQILKDNTGKTLYQLRQEAQLGAQLDTPAAVSRFINEVKKPGFKDMVIEAWMAYILSGIKTHVANIVGNSITALTRPVETATAAAIGKVRDVIAPGGERVHMAEARAELAGMMQGAKEGIVAAGKAFMTEEPVFTPTRQTEHYPKAIPSFTVNVAGREMQIGGKQLRIPLRALTAEDEFFKGVSFRSSINRQATATAIREGLEGDALHNRIAELSMNPTEEMIAAGRKDAEYMTFQNPLGWIGLKLSQITNAEGLPGFAAKMVLPFVRTPLNILKYAGERSPLGLFSKEVRENLSGKNGDIARDTQTARIMLGTMAGLAVYEFVANGQVTGGGPNDRSKRSIMISQGWQPYSVKIGDMYYAYNRLDPFSMIMGSFADIYEISHLTSEKEQKHLMSLMFAAISNNILEKTFFRGLSDIVKALSDSERYGSGYINNLVASFAVPALVNQTNQAIDPTMREARTMIDAIKARIPGLSQTLMPKRDVWGEPIVREGGLGPDFMSPFNTRSIKSDPVNKALLDAGFFPSKVQRKISGVELSDKQYDDYARISGRMTKQRLGEIVQMQGFEQLPKFVREEMMRKTVEASRRAAREAVMMRYPEILQKAVAAKEARRLQ